RLRVPHRHDPREALSDGAAQEALEGVHRPLRLDGADLRAAPRRAAPLGLPGRERPADAARGRARAPRAAGPDRAAGPGARAAGAGPAGAEGRRARARAAEARERAARADAGAGVPALLRPEAPRAPAQQGGAAAPHGEPRGLGDAARRADALEQDRARPRP